MPLSIPPLLSGGIILTWRCTNACRHCLYRCSPKQPADFMDDATMDRVFAALAREPQLSGIHLAGGEPTMGGDRLETAVRKALAAGLSVDYLETNGAWCDDAETAREGFRRLRKAGLRAALVSASLFHLEFIPLRKTLLAIEAAAEAFGGNVIVWTQDVLEAMLGGFDRDRTYTLAESCAALGLDPDGPDLWRMHGYLHPNGRAAEALGKGLPRRPASAFAGDACRRTLQQTSHFHIDREGNLFTGLCPGIAPMATPEFHAEIRKEEFPVFTALCEEGPCGLLPLARETSGFSGGRSGYFAKCQLCLELRKALAKTGTFRELRPAMYYA